MTKITPHRNASGRLTGFRLDGHANYGAVGFDIVCAAISALTTATVNGLSVITGKDVDVVQDDGLIDYRIRGKPNKVTDAMLLSVQLAYMDIAELYPDYVSYVG